jgi:hypothetical protein
MVIAKIFDLSQRFHIFSSKLYKINIKGINFIHSRPFFEMLSKILSVAMNAVKRVWTVLNQRSY